MIPVCEPTLEGKELELVSKAVKSGWISSSGKYIKQFGYQPFEYDCSDNKDNDGDGEIDEEGEMELIVFYRGKAKGGPDGSGLEGDDGTFIHKDGIDNDGDGEIDEADTDDDTTDATDD